MAAVLALLGAGAAAALDVALAAPAVAVPAASPGLQRATQETLPAQASPAAEEAAISVPSSEARDMALLAAGYADQQVARGIALTNAEARNATAAVNRLARLRIPDPELFNATSLATAWADGTAAQTQALAASEAALAGAVAARKATEADRARLVTHAEATALASAAEGLARDAATDAPAAAAAMVAEARRIADAARPDPSAALDAPQAFAGALPGAVDAQARLAAARACATPEALAGGCTPQSVGGDAAATLAREAAMDGVLGAEADAASLTVEQSLLAARGYGTAAGAASLEAALLVAEGLAERPDPALLLPFDQAEDLALASAQAVAAAAFAARDGGNAALDGTAPAIARVRSASSTAANVTLATAQAGGALKGAAQRLLAEACADPLAGPVERCGDGSLVRSSEATLAVATDVAAVGAGRARARLTGGADAQTAGSIVLLNDVARSAAAVATRMGTATSGAAVPLPVGEAGSAGHGRAERDQPPLGGGAVGQRAVAGDIQAEPGQAAGAAMGLAAQGTRAGVAPAGAIVDSATSVVATALR